MESFACRSRFPETLHKVPSFLIRPNVWHKTNSWEGEKKMKKSIYLLTLLPLVLVGCGGEPTTVTTTTTTQEVTTTGPAREVVVTRPPPSVRVETRTVAPGPGYVWTTGYWRWTGGDYAWVPGTWVARPRPAAVWMAGHWVRRPGGWVWIGGHWQ